VHDQDPTPPPSGSRGSRRRHSVDAWIADQGTSPPHRAGSPLTRASRAGARKLTGSVRSLFETGGPGFRDLAVTQVCSTMADTLVAIGLAGTLFFQVPTAEARGNVALYLLLTVAPFAVIGPVLGRVLDRTPVATRRMLVAAALGRSALAVAALGRMDSLWLFPVAFLLLVLSRVHGITRHALLPLALDAPRALVEANARLAWIGVLAGGLAAAIGLPALQVAGGNGPLALAAVAALGAAAVGHRLPEPDGAATRAGGEPWRGLRLQLPREVRLAQLATAGVRVLNGFLLLLLAFELQQRDADLLDFGALLASAGIGYAIASRVVPLVARRVREEPMVLAALAITAAAAFTAGQWFGLIAAASLAGAAGIAWGFAKLAFDGLLQSTVPADRRGAAFTRSETIFSVAWVLGAIVPTAVPLPASVGLALVGFAALAAQIVYVTVLLLPDAGPRRPDDPTEAPPMR
jgi:hypothetical protein